MPKCYLSHTNNLSKPWIHLSVSFFHIINKFFFQHQKYDRMVVKKGGKSLARPKLEKQKVKYNNNNSNNYMATTSQNCKLESFLANAPKSNTLCREKKVKFTFLKT